MNRIRAAHYLRDYLATRADENCRSMEDEARFLEQMCAGFTYKDRGGLYAVVRLWDDDVKAHAAVGHTGTGTASAAGTGTPTTTPTGAGVSLRNFAVIVMVSTAVVPRSQSPASVHMQEYCISLSAEL